MNLDEKIKKRFEELTEQQKITKPTEEWIAWYGNVLTLVKRVCGSESNEFKRLEQIFDSYVAYGEDDVNERQIWDVFKGVLASVKSDYESGFLNEFSLESLQGDTLELIEPLKRFRSDHPDPSKVAFIMMQFTDTDIHKGIVQATKETLSKYGISGVRADDKEYADDLLSNVRTYMHGCGFGIAIFERLTEDDFNPNVSLEVGYLMSQNKSICLLKDKTLKTLQTDLAGKLYRPFDPQDPLNSIPPVLEKWMLDKGVILAIRGQNEQSSDSNSDVPYVKQGLEYYYQIETRFSGTSQDLNKAFKILKQKSPTLILFHTSNHHTNYNRGLLALYFTKCPNLDYIRDLLESVDIPDFHFTDFQYGQVSHMIAIEPSTSSESDEDHARRWAIEKFGREVRILFDGKNPNKWNLVQMRSEALPLKAFLDERTKQKLRDLDFFDEEDKISEGGFRMIRSFYKKNNQDLT